MATAAQHLKACQKLLAAKRSRPQRDAFDSATAYVKAVADHYDEVSAAYEGMAETLPFSLANDRWQATHWALSDAGYRVQDRAREQRDLLGRMTGGT